MSEPKWTKGPWSVVREGLRGGVYWCVTIPGMEEGIDLHEGDNGEANARLIAKAPTFAEIAARAQYLANERGGDYSALTLDELCAFMAEYDDALSKAQGEE